MRVVEEFTPVSERDRLDLSDRHGGRAGHREAFASVLALNEIEVGGAARSRSVAPTSVTAAAWNVQRGTHLDATASLLEEAGPDLVLLTELDIGMARSRNRHTARELARRLGHQYGFAVEFVELGLGLPGEAAGAGPGATNSHGLHGNAILTNGELSDVHLVRIEADGTWFAHPEEPRVGGRCAVTARVRWGTESIIACSVHLESESDPDLRATQMKVVLDAIDDLYGAGPAIIGGDLNTVSAALSDVLAPGGHATLTADDPSRWTWPVLYEPLFDLAADHGFRAEGSNLVGSTWRISADQAADALLPRLDWLLVRDLETRDPRTVPAIDPHGGIISDHDLVSVTVDLA